MNDEAESCLEYPDYDVFYDTLMTAYEEFESVAKDKLEREHYSVAQLPVFGVEGTGDAGNADFNSLKDKLSEYARNHGSGDYAVLNEMIDTLEAAKFSINGAVSSEGAQTGGTDDLIDVVDDGLDSWKSEASELFQENYVKTIGSRKANQVASIQTAIWGLEDAKQVLLDARTKIVQIMWDATAAMNDYVPEKASALAAADLTLTVTGFKPGLKVGVGMAIALAGKKLPKGDGLCVLTMMWHIEDAIDEQAKSVQDAGDYLTEQYTAQADSEAETWSQYVCAKPEVPAYVHG